MDGAKKRTNVATRKPAPQMISKPKDPMYSRAAPPSKTAIGVRPWEPIFVTLETLPNLSLSIMRIIAVVDRTLMRTMKTPITK